MSGEFSLSPELASIAILLILLAAIFRGFRINEINLLVAKIDLKRPILVETPGQKSIAGGITSLLLIFILINLLINRSPVTFQPEGTDTPTGVSTSASVDISSPVSVSLATTPPLPPVVSTIPAQVASICTAKIEAQSQQRDFCRIYASPSQSSDTSCIASGTSVVITRKSETETADWLLIEVEGRELGWVMRDYLVDFDNCSRFS